MSIDRAGHALAAGGAAVAVVATGALFIGGLRGASALATTAFVAAFIGTIAIVAVGGPIWLALHALGHRGPRAAATAGAAAALLLAVFGMALLPSGDGPLIARLLAGLGWILGLAGAGAAIALLMWRIAYRRVALVSRA